MKPAELTNVDRIAIELGHAGRNAIPTTTAPTVRSLDLPPLWLPPDRPVVIVQHGVRNGDEYRDFWVPAADKHKLLIVALTFSNEIWPGVESYNNACSRPAAIPPSTAGPTRWWAAWCAT